ncbi:hypothetical protein AB0I28_22940 [Phytomonospora sp. NPDC050363]
MWTKLGTALLAPLVLGGNRLRLFEGVTLVGLLGEALDHHLVAVGRIGRK